MGWGTDGHNSATCGRVSGIVCPSSAIGSTFGDGFTHAEEPPGLGVRRFYARGPAAADTSVGDTALDSVLVRCCKLQESIVRTRSSDRCTSGEMTNGFQEQTTTTTTNNNRSDTSSIELSSRASTVALPLCDPCLDNRTPIKMTSHQRSSRRNIRSPKMGLVTSILSVIVIFTLASMPVSANMHIKAFEYRHKFDKSLELGECPKREIVNPLIRGYRQSYRLEACTLRQNGKIVTKEEPLKDYRNVLIKNASEIVKYIGLCGGEAASYLGILNGGDCVAVDIANKLLFNEKTMVRAFVGYFRKSTDVLESTPTVLRPGMESYYEDKYFLKSRSYGTIEIIFLQVRFRHEQERQNAQKISLSSPLMSDYMKTIRYKVTTPVKVNLLSLSTSSQEPLKQKSFDLANWDRAVRDVEIQEMLIEKNMEKISKGLEMPHLEYEFSPFLESAVYRNTNPLTWEDISMLEVSLKQTLNQAKKFGKMCTDNRERACQRIKEVRRSLKKALEELHKGRSSWVTKTKEEKTGFLQFQITRAQPLINLTESLSKEIKLMKKTEQSEIRVTKMKEINQIPHTEQQRNLITTHRFHRMRQRLTNMRLTRPS